MQLARSMWSVAFALVGAIGCIVPAQSAWPVRAFDEPGVLPSATPLVRVKTGLEAAISAEPTSAEEYERRRLREREERLRIRLEAARNREKCIELRRCPERFRSTQDDPHIEEVRRLRRIEEDLVLRRREREANDNKRRAISTDDR